MDLRFIERSWKCKYYGYDLGIHGTTMNTNKIMLYLRFNFQELPI